MIDLKQAAPKQTIFLKNAFQQDKLAHAYLFVDNLTQRALATAYWLACLANCTGDNRPDGTCINCKRVLSGNHPDVFLVRPEGKQSLSIDQIRPLKEELAKSPVEGTRRFFFIENAQTLTMPAANALLNLLEEPVAPVTTILLTNNAQQILPTIRSRTQILEFNDLVESSSKNQELLLYGFSQEDLENLGETAELDQAVKYFYQELLENNDLAVISVHKLAGMIKNKVQEDYVFYLLKKFCSNGIKKQQLLGNQTLLGRLLDCDKMKFSNVSFLNRLDYLALS